VWADDVIDVTENGARSLEEVHALKNSYYIPGGWSKVPTSKLYNLLAQGTLKGAGQQLMWDEITTKQQPQSQDDSKLAVAAPFEPTGNRSLKRRLSYP
jgi:hypothetical protein